MPEENNDYIHNDPKVIDAEPEKDLFIFMLTRDIPLLRAIIDLVDNSVDGARRMRPSGNYTDLTVRIVLDARSFRIHDNCGGIPVHIARHYAFRFGKPRDRVLEPHSIGQFGVGMKRAMFKMGNKLEIVSNTKDSHFCVEIDVARWRNAPSWEFQFKELEENVAQTSLSRQPETIITITDLHESVSENFGDENFRITLIEELQAAQQENMDRGLTLTVNGIPLKHQPALLKQSELIKPAFRELHFGEEGPNGVTVRMFIGIADSNPEDGGWYVFCNGRLVLEADHTERTGWGTSDVTRIPRYHHQYARFRGYIYFDSDDASLLPWNTTKTGIDTDSPIYRSTYQTMKTLMAPVIKFLNDLKRDSAGRDDEDQGALERAVDAAVAMKVSEVRTATVFVAPRAEVAKAQSKVATIKYNRNIDEIDKVKNRLGVQTYKEVGERTFEYYYYYELAERLDV